MFVEITFKSIPLEKNIAPHHIKTLDPRPSVDMDVSIMDDSGWPNFKAKGSPIVSLALSMDFVRLIYLEVFSMLINVRKKFLRKSNF